MTGVLHTARINAIEFIVSSDKLTYFDSCRGLRIFLCPTLVSCWLIHLHIIIIIIFDITNRAHEDSIKRRMFFRELAITNFEFPKVNFRNDAIADFDQRFSSIFHEKNRICEQPYLRH